MSNDIDYMISVMQAAKRGEEIQVNAKGSDKYWMTSRVPNWNWSQCDYRVKPKEPDRIYIVKDDSFHRAYTESGLNHAEQIAQMWRAKGYKGVRVVEVREVLE